MFYILREFRKSPILFCFTCYALQERSGGCLGRGGWQACRVLPRKVIIIIFVVFFCDLWWLSKTIIVLDRQGEPILVQNLFNVAILNVLWVIVASHRCHHIVVFSVILHHFDDNPSGMTCPTPKLNTLFASSQNPFRLKWDSFLIPQSSSHTLKSLSGGEFENPICAPVDATYRPRMDRVEQTETGVKC